MQSCELSFGIRISLMSYHEFFKGMDHQCTFEKLLASLPLRSQGNEFKKYVIFRLLEIIPNFGSYGHLQIIEC